MEYFFSCCFDCLASFFQVWCCNSVNCQRMFQSSIRPLAHGIRYLPSGRFSSLQRPTGSSVEGMWMDVRARWIISLSSEWRCQWPLLISDMPSHPLSSTISPSRNGAALEYCILDGGRHTVYMWSCLLSRRVPTFLDGSAMSQTPASGHCKARRRASVRYSMFIK